MPAAIFALDDCCRNVAGEYARWVDAPAGHLDAGCCGRPEGFLRSAESFNKARYGEFVRPRSQGEPERVELLSDYCFGVAAQQNAYAETTELCVEMVNGSTRGPWFCKSTAELTQFDDREVGSFWLARDGEKRVPSVFAKCVQGDMVAEEWTRGGRVHVRGEDIDGGAFVPGVEQRIRIRNQMAGTVPPSTTISSPTMEAAASDTSLPMI
ncbi:hypothetical protein GCM10009563_12530 [Subtercola frigoramans]